MNPATAPSQSITCATRVPLEATSHTGVFPPTNMPLRAAESRGQHALQDGQGSGNHSSMNARYATVKEDSRPVLHCLPYNRWWLLCTVKHMISCFSTVLHAKLGKRNCQSAEHRSCMASHLMKASAPSTMLSKGLMQAGREPLTAAGASYSRACCSCMRRKHSFLLGRLNGL